MDHRVNEVVYICFVAEVNFITVGQLMDIVSQKQLAGHTRFVILIHSPGGDPDAAVTCYHFLNGFQNLDIVTHNIGMVASAAVVLFCAGHVRLCSPYAYFHIHEIYYRFSNGVTGEEEDLIDKYNQLELGRRQSAEILAKTANRTVEQAEKDMKETVILDSVYSVTWKLTHRVTEKFMEIGNQVLFIRDNEMSK